MHLILIYSHISEFALEDDVCVYYYSIVTEKSGNCKITKIAISKTADLKSDRRTGGDQGDASGSFRDSI